MFTCVFKNTANHIALFCHGTAVMPPIKLPLQRNNKLVVKLE